MAYDQTNTPGAAGPDPNQPQQNAASSYAQQQAGTTMKAQGEAGGIVDPLTGQVQPPAAPQLNSASLFPSDTQTNWADSYKPGASGGVVQNPTGTSSELVNQLSGRINQGLAIDPQTDAVIKPQVDAFAANATRSNRDLLNNNAEANGPYATGANQTARTQAAEKESQDINALQGQLVQNELTARRGDINSASNDLGGLLGADQQLALSRAQGGVNANLSQQQLNNTLGLGVLGANLQQQNTTNQNNQFYSGLSAADQQFLNNLSYQYAGLNSANTNAANQLDFQKQQLASNNDQFANTFNLNSTNQANYWDAIRSGLI